MPSTRFVILHHRTADGEHWDFMIEQADALATWRLAANPVDRPGDSIPATRLADHRKVYLDYEGPLTAGRGEVARVESGLCDIHRLEVNGCTVRLHGLKCSGEYTLQRMDEERWTMQPSCPDTP